VSIHLLGVAKEKYALPSKSIKAITLVPLGPKKKQDLGGA
jgi:hypothetical protein